MWNPRLLNYRRDYYVTAWSLKPSIMLRPIAVTISFILGLGQICGCGSAPAGQMIQTKSVGTMNPPIILSSNPDRDALAYEQSEEQLTEADWAVLERLGPRPIWEKIEHRSQSNHRRHARAAKPPTQPAAPATQPTGPIDETDLPVQTVELPDGKLRVIWALRNIGGTTVASTRDPVTSRRTLTTGVPDLVPLVTVLQGMLDKAGTVTALPRENTVVVTCDQVMKRPVLDLLRKLDVPPRQVEITAKVFEVSHDFDFQQGTEMMLNRLANDSSQTLISTFSAQKFLQAMSSGTNAPVQGSVLNLMHVFEKAGINMDVSFQLLQESGLIQVVSSPRIMVAAGQTGYMLAGQEVPIQSTNLVNNIVQIGTTYKPVGVQLYITPEAVGPRRIKLHTISIVSAISGFSPIQTTQGITPVINPVIDSREAETSVTVDDGTTLVISGLQLVRTTTREDQIPGLGSLPIFGWLFKNHRTQQQHTDLYFFITPELIG